MDALLTLAEQNTDEMRQEIDVTRFAMADKLEALESRVMGTVQSAQDTVEESIQTAKDTVATVKRNFDVKYQVEQHPWAMVGGCILAGVALSGLFLRVRRRSPQAPDRPTGKETVSTSPALPADQRGNGSFATATPLFQFQAPPPNRPGLFDLFHDEIDKAKGMALAYVMGLARDSIKDAVPQLASQIDEVMNSLTTKLGSKPAQ